MYDYLVVGAGFFGSVVAERLANELGKKVLVIDSRDHIGGNCYSEIDPQTAIEFHTYGTHIFHTADKKVWDYITKFTAFNSYRHQVLATHQDKVYQMPINLETINSFYKCNLKPQEAKEFLRKEIAKEKYPTPKNLEEKAISLIGRPLYEAFIKGYTTKQWGINPCDLPASIITRLPVRYNYVEDYFVNCTWQGIPEGGYTNVFRKLLSSPNIEVKLNCDFFEIRDQLKIKEKIIYSGPIDRYFDYSFGYLEYRGLDFEKKYFDYVDYQGTSVMNYVDLDVPYTRVHEPLHLHPERQYNNTQTIVFIETPNANHETPYYPVNTEKNNTILKKYLHRAKSEQDVLFGGRLGEYAYYDMDRTILSALECFEGHLKKLPCA